MQAMEPCGRCNGTGSYTVRLGKPGQDVRKVGARNLEWLPTFGPYRCAVCDGTGLRVSKPVIRGRFRIPSV